MKKSSSFAFLTKLAVTLRSLTCDRQLSMAHATLYPGACKPRGKDRDSTIPGNPVADAGPTAAQTPSRAPARRRDRRATDYDICAGYTLPNAAS